MWINPPMDFSLAFEEWKSNLRLRESLSWGDLSSNNPMISNTRLAIYKGTQLDLAFPVTETATTIGRDDGNSIQLPDPQVSKRHAVIRTKDGVWTIEDLNSTNGIKVNGSGVQRTVLKNGDRIHIGPFDLVFESTATDEWVPSVVIDMSSKVAYQTIVQGPKGPPAGFGDRRG